MQPTPQKNRDKPQNTPKQKLLPGKLCMEQQKKNIVRTPTCFIKASRKIFTLSGTSMSGNLNFFCLFSLLVAADCVWVCCVSPPPLMSCSSVCCMFWRASACAFICCISCSARKYSFWGALARSQAGANSCLVVGEWGIDFLDGYLHQARKQEEQSGHFSPTTRLRNLYLSLDIRFARLRFPIEEAKLLYSP